MIGVTIASTEFEPLATEAAKRFRRHTKITKTIIVSTQNEKNYVEKLNLSKLLSYGETLVFFDSDLWFIRDVDLRPFENQREFIACIDPGCKPEYEDNHFPYKDSLSFGLDPSNYFNGGFFVFNERHTEAFEYAKKWMDSVKHKAGRKYIDNKILKDFGEQTSLNVAMKECKIPVKIISSRYNYMPFAVIHTQADREEYPFAVHAAGYGRDRQFPEEGAGAMKCKILQGYEYRYKSEREDFLFH